MSHHETHDPSPDDEALRAAEDALRDLVPRDPVAARPRFRAELRAAFRDGSLARDVDERETLGAEVDDALRGWDVPAASGAARARARAALVGGRAPEATVHTRGTRRPRAGGATRGGGRARRAAPAGSNTRLRLVVGGGLLAAAAAALAVYLVGGDTGRIPQVEDVPAVADAPVIDAPAPGPKQGPWTVEELPGSDFALASVRVDGEAPGGADDLRGRIHAESRLETGDAGLRLRHGDAFVLELAPGSVVEFLGQGAAPGVHLRLSAGALRVATGPDFTPDSLVVESEQVRARVLGTIFGLDIGEGYTCVCCLEGEVWTESLVGGDARGVPEGMTRVVQAVHPGEPDFDTGPIVPDHALPLRELAGYWG